MIVTTITGNVVEVNRHIKGTKLSILRIVSDNDGQTVEDGKWGQREGGFFDIHVFEENLMMDSNKDFSGIMGSLKKGSTIQVVATISNRVTKKDGKFVSKEVIFSAQKLLYVNTGRRPEETPSVQRAAAAQEEFREVLTDDTEEEYHADILDD